MLKGKSEVINNSKVLMQLWEHECSRVLPDRFTNPEDIDWFQKALVQIVQKEYGDEFASAISTKSMFVDFMRDPPESDDPDVQIDIESVKIYEPIKSMEEVRARVSEFMRLYNETIRGSKMDLVLFDDALQHISRISRILRTPR
jgi:dynein heavy chain